MSKQARSGSTSPTGSRPYRSTLRQDQARATRLRIVDAARALFIEQGYASATIDAVAARAGVSRKTVFSSVGGKAELLTLAWDWALAGDDEPIGMADRPEVRRILELDDGGEAVAAWAQVQAAVAARLAGPFQVLVVAADVDADAAALLARNEGHRRSGARTFVEHLDAIGALRADLDVERATEIAAVLMDPTPAGRLVGDAGWAIDDYIALVERMARAALLA